MRALAVLGATLAVGWASASHVIANISADRNPDLALRFAPRHPVALAEKAEQLFHEGELAEAKALAIKSIRGAAISSAAMRVLGQVEGSTSPGSGAERLFRYTIRLNQREVPAQAWLFQRRLMEGDVVTALRHIDAAMRVSGRTRGTLYPVLAAAIASQDLREPVSAMFAREPAWLMGFVHFAISRNASLPSLARILAHLPDDSPMRTPELQAKLLQRMAEVGEYSAARDFLRGLTASGTETLVRDPSFNVNGPYAPFDWQYSNEAGLSAVPVPGSEAGLAYNAATGQGGRVAGQLLTLAPGSYSLVSTGRKSSSDSDGRPIWTVTCADAASPDPIAQLPMQSEATDQSHRIATEFTVPAQECPAQWLDLTLQATFDPKNLRGEISNIVVTPIARHDRTK